MSTASLPSPAPDTSWLPGLLQLTDSFFPTGAYAHSFGLEGLVQEGAVTNAATLREFLLHAFLPALGKTDLPIAALAWTAMRDVPDWEEMAGIGERCAALKPAREPREASENIGRQRVDMLRRLHPGNGLVEEFHRQSAARGWAVTAPIAAALEGRVLGVPQSGVMAAVFYSASAGVLAAAMKLVRIGQNTAQSLLSEALALAPAMLETSSMLTLSETGFFNPWLDIAAARHETADGRLFIS